MGFSVQNNLAEYAINPFIINDLIKKTKDIGW